MLPILAAGASLLAKPLIKAVGGLLSKPIVRVAASAGIAAAGTKLLGQQPSTLPALPSMGSLPTIVNQNTALQASSPGGLPVPFWKGPGGKLQMPWSDPRVPEYLKQFSLDDAYLKPYYRAPRGYVIVRDASGRPFAVNKTIAKQFGIWKQPAKPPISATDWKHYKRNQQIEKKLLKIAAPAIRHRHKSTKTVVVSSKRRAA